MSEFNPAAFSSSDELKEEQLQAKALTISINKQFILNALLVLLIAAAAFQSYFLFGLQNRVKSGLKIAPAAAANGVSSPSNLQNLPSMVGGC